MHKQLLAAMPMLLLVAACNATVEGPGWQSLDCQSALQGHAGTISAVWAKDGNHAWALTDDGRVLYYDGETCVQEAQAPSGVELRSIWGEASAAQIWAVGADALGNGFIFRRDHTGWSPEAPNTTSSLVRVWGTAETGPIAVGYFPHAVMSRRDGVWGLAYGNTADPAALDPQPGVPFNLAGVGPISTSSRLAFVDVGGTGPNDLWVIGLEGAHYDGESWTPNATYQLRHDQVTEQRPISAHTDSESKRSWMVGADATLYHLQADYEVWDESVVLTDASLHAIHSGGPNSTVWAVGSQGVIAKQVAEQYASFDVVMLTTESSDVNPEEHIEWLNADPNVTNGNVNFHGVWVDAEGGVWVVGEQAHWLYRSPVAS